MPINKCPECGRICRKRDGLYYCPECEETFNGRQIGARIEEGFHMLSDDYEPDGFDA